MGPTHGDRLAVALQERVFRVKGEQWELFVYGRHDCGDGEFLHIALIGERTLTLTLELPAGVFSYATALLVEELICDWLAAGDCDEHFVMALPASTVPRSVRRRLEERSA